MKIRLVKIYCHENDIGLDRLKAVHFNEGTLGTEVVVHTLKTFYQENSGGKA